MRAAAAGRQLATAVQTKQGRLTEPIEARKLRPHYELGEVEGKSCEALSVGLVRQSSGGRRALADGAGEHRVADDDGRGEDVEGRDAWGRLDHRLVPRYNEQREDDGEDAAGDDLALGEAGDHGEGEAEAQEVRPVGLHVVQPAVELQALKYMLVKILY